MVKSTTGIFWIGLKSLIKFKEMKNGEQFWALILFLIKHYAEKKMAIEFTQKGWITVNTSRFPFCGNVWKIQSVRSQSLKRPAALALALFSLSTQSIKPNYFATSLPTEHHSFFRNLLPFIISYLSGTGNGTRTNNLLRIGKRINTKLNRKCWTFEWFDTLCLNYETICENWIRNIFFLVLRLQ